MRRGRRASWDVTRWEETRDGCGVSALGFAALVAMRVLTVGAGVQETPRERRVIPVRSRPPEEAARPTAVQELRAQDEVPSPKFQPRRRAALPPVPAGHA